MTPEQFTYWLQGFLECKEVVNKNETAKIQENLDKVFNKVTPNRSIRNNTRRGGSLVVC